MTSDRERAVARALSEAQGVECDDDSMVALSLDQAREFIAMYDALRAFDNKERHEFERGRYD